MSVQEASSRKDGANTLNLLTSNHSDTSPEG